MQHATVEDFSVRGYGVVRGLVDSSWLARAAPLLDDLLGWPGSPRPGARRAIARQPALIELICIEPIQLLMESLCGPGVRIVRAMVFDKTVDSNWAVPWHQDATIAVEKRIDVAGFGPWSIKSGEQHCQPPRDVLDRLVTLRIHIDTCGPDNGPLRVIAGSHAHGLVSDAHVVQLAATGQSQELNVAAGDAVVMHPHVVHSSPRATAARRRRVLHIDCTSALLPGGLRWAEELALRAEFDDRCTHTTMAQ